MSNIMFDVIMIVALLMAAYVIILLDVEKIANVPRLKQPKAMKAARQRTHEPQG